MTSPDRPHEPAAEENARLVLVTAPGCHLCESARGEIARLAGEAGVAWHEHDLAVTGAPDPLWWEQVPLVLVDGAVVCYWRVDASRVRDALATAPR